MEAAKKNAAIDWTLRESVRAQSRGIVKRVVRKYSYRPDKRENDADRTRTGGGVVGDLGGVSGSASRTG